MNRERRRENWVGYLTDGYVSVSGEQAVMLAQSGVTLFWVTRMGGGLCMRPIPDQMRDRLARGESAGCRLFIRREP